MLEILREGEGRRGSREHCHPYMMIAEFMHDGEL